MPAFKFFVCCMLILEDDQVKVQMFIKKKTNQFSISLETLHISDSVHNKVFLSKLIKKLLFSCPEISV